MFYLVANRDPDVLADPLAFDVRRASSMGSSILQRNSLQQPPAGQCEYQCE